MIQLLHSSQPLYFLTHAKENTSEARASAKFEGMAEARRAKRRIKKSHVKSPVLPWRPVLLQLFETLSARSPIE